MWVVKLGGSLLGSADLPRWLNLLADHGDKRIVIVPGGSVFADAVRAAQKLSGVNDAVAHRLAVCAMDQYGLLLAGLCPRLVTAASMLELAAHLRQQRTTIWLPSQMVLADSSIPASWDVTSDSLAAWLAAQLSANRLLLVKSLPAAHLANMDRAKLCEEVVDREFPRFAGTANLTCWILSSHAIADFARALQQGDGFGVRIVF